MLTIAFFVGSDVLAQVNYTANDTVTPYTGFFRPGINFDYYPPYTNIDLANIAAGNPGLGLQGIGAVASRPALSDVAGAEYGYDLLVLDFAHFENLGMGELTMIVGFASDEHKIQQNFCDANDPQHIFCTNDFYNPDCSSDLFENMYTPIFDDGSDGTPINDENYLAAYIYKMVKLYGDHVRFWEIWNEPGFDHSYLQGWQEPGSSSTNWWDEDPSPCVNHFHAPIEYFVRTLRICYEVIKSEAPDDYVVLAGVGFESFLDAVLRNTDNPVDGSPTPEYPYGGGAYFDVMGFHTYPDIDGSVRYWDQNLNQFVYTRHSDAASEGVPKRKQTYENRLAMYGYDGVTYPKKEWIITELNSPRKKFNPESMASVESQINYIIKATAKAMRIGVRQMHPYQLADRKKENKATGEFDLLGMYYNFTFTNPYDALQKTEEGKAYTTVAKFVYRTTYDADRTAAMNLPDNLDGVALWDQANGRYKYILWAKTTIDKSEAASGTYSFPASFNLTELTKREWDFSETAYQTTISPNNIYLTGRPIFLIEPASVQSKLTTVCPNDTTIVGDAETVVLDWAPPVYSTTCGLSDVTAVQTVGELPGTPFNHDISQLVVYQFTDACDNIASCSFTVTGQLQEPEISITCPDDIYVTVPQGQSGTNVNWDPNDIVLTTNCGEENIFQVNGPSNGEFFPVGSTMVQFVGLSVNCRDSMTLNTNCSFFVTVSETGGGSSVLNVNCPTDTTIVGTDTEVTLNWDLPQATTTCPGGNINITQQSGPPLGTSFTQPTTVTVSYTVEDDCGTSTQCTFHVTGELQVTSPEIHVTCPDDIVVTVPQGDTGAVVTWNPDDVVLTANCGFPTVTQAGGPASGSFFPLGTTPVSYVGVSVCNGQTISDACSFNVVVQTVVGTHDEESPFEKFAVFPNPTRDKVEIDLLAERSDYVSIDVLDDLGRVLIAKKYGFGTGGLHMSLDLSLLPNGHYTVRVRTRNKVGVKRIVVER